MRSLIFLIIFLPGLIIFQAGSAQSTVNDLPKFIPPTPEAASLLKIDNLSVGYTTGAANINIPLYTLSTGDYSLPISLSYSSTGIKVDEIASMVGTGWSLNFGGVVSRTVMGIPDEMRDTSKCNLKSYNFSSPNYALMQFLGDESADKASDIYSFSFGKYSGKFILGLNNEPIQLSKYNIKIASFGVGWAITTDDGVQYRFEAIETSLSRNSSGTGCKNDSWNGEEVITSWFLTKIVLPSGEREINFTYINSATTFSSSISQTLSVTVASENYQCSPSAGPSGAACPLYGIQYSSCTNLQTVSSKFISVIQTGEGDKIQFFYDQTTRTDLIGGLRLASLKITNRDNQKIKNVVFAGSYQTAANANSTVESYRLFLDSVKVYGQNTISNALVYKFGYIDYSNLSRRLSFAQDMYGYYNGKTNNASLLPILSSGDVNYTIFNNGTSYGSYSFGDRSIDSTYAIKGLLSKIVYHTGGFDSIEYKPNKFSSAETLCGGSSVAKIKSYTGVGLLATEKEFIYRYISDNSLSTFVLIENVIFSFRQYTNKDGYFCQNESGQPTFTACVGPQCQMATISSNANNSITTYGSQHVYHRVVQEIQRSGTSDLGKTEHIYDYFMAGSLVSNNIMNDPVLASPCHIIPDIFIGEIETNYYRNSGPQTPTYYLIRKIKNTYENDGFSHYSNYEVKRNYTSTCGGGPGNPPHSSELGQFDVNEIYVYKNTSRLINTVERNFEVNIPTMVDSTAYVYDNSVYSYPTQTLKMASNGDILKQKLVYSFDYDTTTVSSNEAIGLRLLRRKGIHKPVEIIQIRKKGGTDYVTNSSLTTFKYNKTVPDKVYILKVSSPIALSTFTQSSVAGGNLSKDSRYDEKLSFVGYDKYNNTVQQARTNDVISSFIWNYKGSYPVAEVVNADSASIAAASFEGNGTGNWSYTGVQITDGSAPTGKKVYNLFTGSITKSGLSSSAVYTVSYWTKNASAFSITGTQSGYPIVGRTLNGWKYFEHKITGQTQITVSGNGLIDELRLYPSNAAMTTITYDPLVGITSQCDANNRINYYEYDEFSRLILIRDMDKNVVKKFCYNYHLQTENCNIYYNEQQQQFIQKECSGNYTGSYETYTVPANTYSSTVSVLDANQKAVDDILANGQAYANALGFCTPTANCTYQNCSGEDKKCINDNCETGVKIYTGSYYNPSTGMWECTYHYEWSDESWSGDYVEYTYGCNQA